MGAPSDLTGDNLFAYCRNNPVNKTDSTGLWCPQGDGTNEHHNKDFGWINGTPEPVVSAGIDTKSPPDHPDYKPPKKGGGNKVKNPNGSGRGWPAKDGGVWMPDLDMDGGEGWTVQYPGGGHKHAYPGGKVRNHFKSEQSMGSSIILIFTGAIATIGLIADDVTGLGVADNSLIAGSTACFVGGLNGVFGEKVCTECGMVRYGY